MALSAGTKLGPYEIITALGAGGMGEVYKARDTRLNRDVAIKVLPASLAADAQYMARFEREAQMLAAMNHPNIATVYGVEQGALIMELVDGPTLADRIAEGRIPLDEAVPLARQIAQGLEAAHERGVIHRDLKPANIKITPTGAVKLLDFGLAKSANEFAAGASGVGNPTISPTLSMAMTQAGMILGTAAYMSPEQARGKPVDRRADIWAYGVVFYEMLTGRQLFGGGETVSDTMASVIKDAPDLSVLPAETPANIRRLLDRCLRKDLKTRLRDIGEALVMLDEPAETIAPAATQVTAAPSPRITWLPWIVAGVCAAIGIVGAWLGWRATRPAPLRPMLRLTADMGEGLPFARSGGAFFDLSPDGTRLAVVVEPTIGKSQLGVRLLNQDRVTLLNDTEGAIYPFFSPDGEWIAFSADHKLKKIAVTGGAPLTLCEARDLRGAAWREDGTIVAALNITGGLSRIPAAGGPPQPLTQLAQGIRTHRYPSAPLGTDLLLYTSSSSSGNYDDANIEAQSLKSGAHTTVLRGGHSPRYVPGGYLLYQHQSTIFAVRFDLSRMATSGTPVPIVEDAYTGRNGTGVFAVARSGAFAYAAGVTPRDVRSISWIDSAGKRQDLHATPGSYTQPRLSPDGRRLVVVIYSAPGVSDLWVKDLDRNTLTRLTFTPGLNISPVWMPDGKAVVYHSSGSAGGLYWIPADGSGQAQRLFDQSRGPYSVSPDGKRLAFDVGSGSEYQIHTVPIEGDAAHPKLGQPEPFVTTKFLNVEPAFSPDGRWIAYSSNESGRLELYVRPSGGQGGRWQISTGGGDHAVWARQGKELFFESPAGIMAVPYTVGTTFVPGNPRLWAAIHPSGRGGNYGWDAAADGKRLVFLPSPEDTADRKPLSSVTFLLNFPDELRRRTTAAPVE